MPPPEKQNTTPEPEFFLSPALLSNLPLFDGVDKAILERLTTSARLRTLAKREYVIRKGSAGEYLLFLVKGRLQVLDVTESGREIGLNFLKPGEYFGELSIIDGLPRSASVVATEASVVLLIPHTEALFLFHHAPHVAERLLKRFAERLRLASAYQAILSMPNASQRIYALLSRFVQIAPGGLTVIAKMPTQQEIAITVNTSRETVSRALRALIQQGVVQKDMRRLIVRKPEALHIATLDDPEK